MFRLAPGWVLVRVHTRTRGGTVTERPENEAATKAHAANQHDKAEETSAQTGPVSGEYVDGAEHVIGTDPRRDPSNLEDNDRDE